MSCGSPNFQAQLLRALTALVALTLLALWTPASAQAQSNSREAIEAARRHRAEQGTAERLTQPPSTEPTQAPARNSRPFSSGADPTADPNASLKSCLDHSGMNVLARDRCMRQHCQGRWGQGDCPAQGGDMLGSSGGNDRTPLGRCLKTAGANPLKRDRCGWQHCNKRWDAPECAAMQTRKQPLAQ